MTKKEKRKINDIINRLADPADSENNYSDIIEQLCDLIERPYKKLSGKVIVKRIDELENNTEFPQC